MPKSVTFHWPSFLPSNSEVHFWAVAGAVDVEEFVFGRLGVLESGAGVLGGVGGGLGGGVIALGVGGGAGGVIGGGVILGGGAGAGAGGGARAGFGAGAGGGGAGVLVMSDGDFDDIFGVDGAGAVAGAAAVQESHVAGQQQQHRRRAKADAASQVRISTLARIRNKKRRIGGVLQTVALENRRGLSPFVESAE